MYYGLTNFYQNHRRYVKSRNDNQLRGVKQTKSTDDCDPFYMTKNDTVRYYYAPCGAIANSMFNGQSDFLTFVLIKHPVYVFQNCYVHATDISASFIIMMLSFVTVTWLLCCLGQIVCRRFSMPWSLIDLSWYFILSKNLVMLMTFEAVITFQIYLKYRCFWFVQ